MDGVFNGLLVGKGANWEYFVSESPRDMWKINGIYPPDAGSEEERVWKEVGRQVRVDGSEYKVQV